MENQEARKRAAALVDKLPYPMLVTWDRGGQPAIRAMTTIEHEGLRTIWFATSVSSRKIEHLRRNPSAMVYIVDSQTESAVTLEGTAQLVQDEQAKQRYWRRGFERWFGGGYDDPRYCLLRFDTQRAVYTEDRANTELDLR